MKKNVLIMTWIVLIAGINLVSAEEIKGGMKGNMMGDSKRLMMDKGIKGKDMMDGKMMMCPMMKSMMDRNVVATSDGGIVIVAGNKLTKYDKDLNVVKEVELKMDMKGMQKMMSDMMGNCPMMKGMMGGMDKQSDKAQEAAPTTSSEVDHASHHK